MTRFFNYTNATPPEYKKNIECTLKKMDRSSNVATYTPFISVFCIAVVGALQTGLSSSSPISPYYGMMTLLLSAGTTLVLGVAKVTESKSQAHAAKLIEYGVKEGFFKDRTITDEEKGGQAPLHLEIDATKLRLIHAL